MTEASFWRVREIVKSGCLLRYISPFFLPSVRMEQLGSQLAEFHEICNLSTFRKFAHRIQLSLKSEETDGYFT
jgi:hypothetical protein